VITAPDRSEPSAGPERTQLEGWLDFHRATLLVKCAGLTDEQLKQRPVASSTLTLLGLMRHMIVVEQWWFEIVLRGVGTHDDLPFNVAVNKEADFEALDETPVAEVEAMYLAMCERSRIASADLPLDTMAVASRRGDRDLRWIFLHMIEEYARHNGHADLLRELIDGETGD